MSWTEAQRKYAHSEKGIAARKRFQQSEKGKALRAKYMAKRKTKLQEMKKKTNTPKPEDKLAEKALKTSRKIPN